MIYDIAVIGGGPAGYTAAEKAAENGLSVILFEKNAIGGVCLNEGCIPTKTLLYSAKVQDNIKSASKYGIVNDAFPTADLNKIISRKNKIVRKLTAGIRMRLAEHNVAIVVAEAFIAGENNGLIKIASNTEIYSVNKVLLCSGSETIIPPIEGLQVYDFWTSKEALNSKELPEKLLVIGGGVIGIEFASFFNSMGVKVEVVEMMSEILGGIDKESATMLRTEYEKKGVVFHLNTKVAKVSAEGVIIEKDDEQQTIQTDKILLSVGRRPNTKGLGLENLNIETYRNGVKVSKFMQTSHPQVYACGDITGHSLLAHTAVREAEVAINHILGKDDAMSYRAIPSVVYTNPEIAGVGKTEDELQASGSEFKVLKIPMAFSGRFVAENEMGSGICKLIVDKNDVVIGCHMLGNPASELIVVAGIAIEKGYSIEEFKKIVFPHPTVGEVIHECLFI